MQFDTANFREKLSQLVDVQESIENTSVWCCLFRDDARKLATEWNTVFRENNQEKRLVLIYLANEIMKVTTSCQPSLYKMIAQYALGCKCIWTSSLSPLHT